MSTRVDPKTFCRVSSDLNRRLRLEDQAEARVFDPWDSALMADLFGKRLAEPMAQFLIALEQIEKTEQTFGVDKEKACDFLLPTLYKLRDACREEFRQL